MKSLKYGKINGDERRDVAATNFHCSSQQYMPATPLCAKCQDGPLLACSSGIAPPAPSIAKHHVSNLSPQESKSLLLRTAPGHGSFRHQHRDIGMGSVGNTRYMYMCLLKNKGSGHRGESEVHTHMQGTKE